MWKSYQNERWYWENQKYLFSCPECYLLFQVFSHVLPKFNRSFIRGRTRCRIMCLVSQTSVRSYSDNRLIWPSDFNGLRVILTLFWHGPSGGSRAEVHALFRLCCSSRLSVRRQKMKAALFCRLSHKIVPLSRVTSAWCSRIKGRPTSDRKRGGLFVGWSPTNGKIENFLPPSENAHGAVFLIPKMVHQSSIVFSIIRGYYTRWHSGSWEWEWVFWRFKRSRMR